MPDPQGQMAKPQVQSPEYKVAVVVIRVIFKEEES